MARCVFSALLEGDPGTVDEILDGVGHEDLSRVGQSGDPCSRMDCDSADVVTAELTLARVEAASDAYAQFRYGLSQRGGGLHCATGTVEDGHGPVAGVADDATAEVGDLSTGDGVVAIEQFQPVSVAEFCGTLGRVDDVGEQHRRQNPVGVVLRKVGPAGGYHTVLAGVPIGVGDPFDHSLDQGIDDCRPLVVGTGLTKPRPERFVLCVGHAVASQDAVGGGHQFRKQVVDTLGAGLHPEASRWLDVSGDRSSGVSRGLCHGELGHCITASPRHQRFTR
jgi:hypothetical protein